MRDKIIYEWSLHEFDGNGDIHHTEYGDSLGDFWADDIWQAITERGDRRLELRRYIGNDDEGTTGIDYAGVSRGELATFFEDGKRSVPRRFHKELAKVRRSLDIQLEDYR